ncbi:MAG: tetratricopeptide repeat protein [Peptococcaceae bacterium]|nr:tetratricopeptide repeat protein [Peptococcaceae bacterium]MDH7525712.1 tetratricopeptide repeat protein [Peptococcaceae bacterium]
MFKIKNSLKQGYFKTMAVLFQLAGSGKKALYYQGKVIEGERVNYKDWSTLGALYARQKQWEKAYRAFAQAARMGRGDARNLYWLGRSSEEMGCLYMAEQFYDEALKNCGNLWEALYAKGEIRLRREDYEGAFQCFRQCLEQEPEDAGTLNNLGLCCLGQNEPVQALSYLERAVKIIKNDGTILYNCATVYIRLGRYKEAAVLLHKIKGGEDQAEIAAALGFCYGMLNKYEESLCYYRKALALDANNREALLNMAAVYAKKGEAGQALEILKNIMAKNSKDPEVLNNIAWVYESMEDLKTAEKHYYRGLAISAGDPQIAYNLVCCLKKQENYLEAIEAIEHLKNKQEWKKIAWSSLAQIYEELGANKLAVDCYNKAFGLE